MTVDQERPRWFFTWGGRCTICGLAAVTVFCLVRWFEVCMWPETATELALAQMQSDSTAAESLRQFSALHGALPWLSAAIVMATGLILFLPGHTRRMNRILESF